MTGNVYERLREHLDGLPVGYPKTESGVEIRILRKLFSEEEAEMACRMAMRPETPEQVAKRLGRDPEETAGLLSRMSKKGLLTRLKVGGTTCYMSAMFMIGIFEYQVNNLDPEFVELIRRYAEESHYREMVAPGTPQLRVIPVQQSLDAAIEIAPYDEMRKILASQDTIALADCICRKMSGIEGRPCRAPLDSCLIFGPIGEFYIENGIGRRITLEEAFKVLERNEAAGLVPSPANAQRVGGMCSCCACCCEMLRAVRLDARPSSRVKSNYFARVDAELCIGCGICVDRCQMTAVALTDDVAGIDLDRCLGCGLCVTTCPTEALSLRGKSAEEHYVPPEKPAETYTCIVWERRKG